ncbi:MAG: hypothetical protein ABI488_16200 [Polyangiaceae bacterium]
MVDRRALGVVRDALDVERVGAEPPGGSGEGVPARVVPLPEQTSGFEGVP